MVPFKSYMQVSGPTETGKKDLLYRVGESEDFGEGITGFSGGAEGCKSLPTKYKGVTIEN